MKLGFGIKLSALIVLGFFVVSGITFWSVRSANAAELKSNVPADSNSTPFDAHVFFMRKDTAIGVSDKTYLEAYYPSSLSASEWNSASLTFKPGAGDSVDTFNVCSPQGPATNKFMKVTLQKVPASSGSSVFWIPRDRMCTQKSGNNSTGTNSSNAFYASYPLPNGRPPADPATNGKYYKLEIIIEYDDAPADAGAVRFQVDGDKNPKMGPRGNGISFPILGKWSKHNEPTTSLTIPFGMSCTESGNRTDKIGIYDADNKMGMFASNDLKFRIKDIDDNQYVQMVNGSSEGDGYFADNRKTYRFNQAGNKAFAGAKIKMEEGHKYEMVITGLHPRNAIDVRVPAGTIFGDPALCAEGWNIKGNSYVKDKSGEWTEAGDELVTIPYNYGSPGYTGGTITAPAYKHRLKNFGTASTGSTGVKWRVKWGQYGNPGSTWPGDNIKSSTDGGDTFDAKQELSLWGAGMNDFAIPDNAQNGDRYCQFVRWWPANSNVADNPSHPNYRKDSSEACVTVEREPCLEGVHAACTNASDPPTRFVNMVAVVNVPSNTETATNATFSGHVQVSNFPQPEEGGWGYKERSSQHDAERQSAQYQYRGWNSSRTVCPPQSDQGTVSGAGATCSHQEDRWDCGGNVYNSDPGTCSVWTGGYGDVYYVDGWPCVNRNASGTCVEWTQYPRRDRVYEDVDATGPRQVTVYDSGTNQYNCLDGSGWQTSCTDRYSCPNSGSGTGWSSGGANSGWAWNAGQITCNVWQCKYPSAPAGRTQDPMKNSPTTYKCSYRCDGSNGDKAYLNPSYDDVLGTGDRRCFVKPKFSLTCFWEDGTSMTVDVDGNGNFCNIQDYQETAGNIGSVVDAELKIKQINPYNDSSWSPSDPAPGTVTSSSGVVSQIYRWRWTKTDGSNESNVVGYSYIKVYGGDVRVGGGVGSINNTGVCAFNSNAEIRTNNKGPVDAYAGSSVQYAAYATGVIDKLISGQFNEYIASPDAGTDPKKLTFAGTSGTYGGNFGSAGPCYDYTGKLSDTAISTTGSTIIPGQGIANGQRIVRHVRGNVFIQNDIAYIGGNSTWVQPIDIPVYQLIVEGNIYIGENVTRLDGMYVAVPTAGNPASGSIYTCATGMGAVPSTTFNNCKTQLVVNGSLSAKRIFPLRDCGSLSMSTPSEPSVFNGGTDQQECSPGNHAAEVVNYSPEMWIRSAIGPARDTYDSLVSLPPVL